jgi:hypothetical protein
LVSSNANTFKLIIEGVFFSLFLLLGVVFNISGARLLKAKLRPGKNDKSINQQSKQGETSIHLHLHRRCCRVPKERRTCCTKTLAMTNQIRRIWGKTILFFFFK